MVETCEPGIAAEGVAESQNLAYLLLTSIRLFSAERDPLTDMETDKQPKPELRNAGQCKIVAGSCPD